MSHLYVDWSELSLQVMFTFGHFLWQGFVIAVLLGIAGQLFSVFSRNSASRRYSIACLAFLALPICVAATFAWVHQSRGPVLLAVGAPIESPAIPLVIAHEPTSPLTSPDVPLLAPQLMPAEADLPVTQSQETPNHESAFILWTAKVQNFAPYVLIAYTIGLCWMLARFGLSMVGGSRLRQTLEPITDPKLLRMVAAQSSRLGLICVPVVALCQRVSVPMVIGIVKPAILLPPALLCGLEPYQLAAILSHEMAHIRRYDLIFNLLQCIVEALLFFHPATWWISRRVSIERENCCDDMAAAECGRIEYAAALLQMAEQCAVVRGLKIAPQLQSLAADGGNPSQLSYRIKRLLGEDSAPRISFTGSSFAAIALMAMIGTVSMVAVAQSGDDDRNEIPARTSVAQWGDESDGLRCRIVPVSSAMDAENIDMAAVERRFESPEDITFAVEIKNVSDTTISLKDVRYGEGTKGNLSANHFAPHLFDLIFTDADSKTIARTQREFVLDSHATILNGAMVVQVEPNQSLRYLLKPAKFERSMDYRLPPGDYQVQVRYRGPSKAVRDWINATFPEKEPDKLWASKVTSEIAGFSIGTEGFRDPDLFWGPETDGMKAALEIRVPGDAGIPTQAPGVLPTTSLLPVLHVKNVSDKPIAFVSETGRQGDLLKIKNARGEDVKFKDVWFTGRPIDVRWIQQPGEVAELGVLTPSLNQAFAPGKYSTQYTIRFNSRQQKDKEGNQVFPAPGHYESEIDTGWTPLFLRDANQAASSPQPPSALPQQESRKATDEGTASAAASPQGNTRTRKFKFVDEETGSPLKGLDCKVGISKQGTPPRLLSYQSNQAGIVEFLISEGERAWLAEEPRGWFAAIRSSLSSGLGGNLLGTVEDGQPKSEPTVLKLWRGEEVTGRLLWPDKTAAVGVIVRAGCYTSSPSWKEAPVSNFGRSSLFRND